MKAHQLPELSIAEYLQMERESGIKYEYHRGKIFALSGGSLNHGLLCGNIYSELRSKLKEGKPDCKAVTSEIKLNVKQKNSFVYPDAMVICGAIEKSADDKNAITNPVLIVEVLSKSTANYDRGDKFYLYRQIPSLQEYLLIEQDKYQVDIYFKQANTDLWKIRRIEGKDALVQLQSLNLEIKMSDLYYDIELPTANG